MDEAITILLYLLFGFCLYVISYVRNYGTEGLFEYALLVPALILSIVANVLFFGLYKKYKSKMFNEKLNAFIALHENLNDIQIKSSGGSGEYEGYLVYKEDGVIYYEFISSRSWREFLFDQYEFISSGSWRKFCDEKKYQHQRIDQLKDKGVNSWYYLRTEMGDIKTIAVCDI